MTVAEYIEALKVLPQDAVLMVQGYEGSVQAAAHPVQIVARYDSPRVWMGDHDRVGQDDYEDEDDLARPHVVAVLVPR